MLVYDQYGNMVNMDAANVATQLGNIVNQLMERLLASGMTILEGRGLIGYLKSEIDMTATISLMKAQIHLTNPKL